MAGRWTVGPVTAEVVEELARSMRAEDVAEILASDGVSPGQALADSIAVSDRVYAVYLSGELAFVTGAAPLDHLPGCPACGWLLSSGAVDRHPRGFIEATREIADAFVDEYGVLVQWVDARYEKALRWVRRLGFDVEDPKPWGRAGLPFCRITRRAVWAG